MLYFNKEFQANGIGGKNHADQFKHVVQRRNYANRVERGFEMVGNAAAVIPRDVYTEFDMQGKALIRANNLTLLNDLMPLAKALPVGKVDQVYRRSSDAGVVTSSLSGQTPAELDKTDYDYDQSIKVIHQAAFGREWMEMEGQRSEGFDGLVDDNANVTRAVIDATVDHIYDGVDVSFKGTNAYGIKTSTKTQAVDLGAGDLNIDFTSGSATPVAMRAAWISLVAKLRTTNNIVQDITFYISSEIEQNFQRFFDDAGVRSGKSVMQVLKEIAGVNDIKLDRKLSGNEVVGVVLDSQFIRPLVGMAISTVPLFRANPFDNYNFLVWTNVGLEIRTDYTGKTGVLYARNITT